MKMKLDGYNYDVFTNNKDYVKVSTKFYDGQVHGYAKLSAGDTFDFDTGLELAKARCDVELFRRRFNAYLEEVSYLSDVLEEIEERLSELTIKQGEAYRNYEQASNHLINICDKLDMWKEQ